MCLIFIHNLLDFKRQFQIFQTTCASLTRFSSDLCSSSLSLVSEEEAEGTFSRCLASSGCYEVSEEIFLAELGAFSGEKG